MRRAIEEWQVIIDNFASSPLSTSAYCKANSLPLSTFHKYKKRLEPAEVDSFIKAELPSHKVMKTKSEYTVELITKAGKLTLSGDVPADYVVQLIKGIGQ